MLDRSASNEKGFSLIELLAVIAIIGILTAIALNQFGQDKVRAYDSDAKASLHNIYMACKAYWSEAPTNINCGLTEATGVSYGFIQSTHVTVTAASATELMFTAQAQHASSINVFSIDVFGNIY